MPGKRRKQGGPIKLEASASATVGAHYSVRKEIREVVPVDVTRAKATSWLDLISPLTEWTGLKGDQLRLKRDILRLHREETLTRITERIRSKGNINPGAVPIPTKFIVNFLEKASLEEQDDELVELWANLLISAAENYDPRQLHFVSIISQLSGSQARIFESIIGTKEENALELGRDLIESDLQASRVREYLTRKVTSEITIPETADAVLTYTIDKLAEVGGEWFNCVGVEFVYGDVALIVIVLRCERYVVA